MEIAKWGALGGESCLPLWARGFGVSIAEWLARPLSGHNCCVTSHPQYGSSIGVLGACSTPTGAKRQCGKAERNHAACPQRRPPKQLRAVRAVGLFLGPGCARRERRRRCQRVAGCREALRCTGGMAVKKKSGWRESKPFRRAEAEKGLRWAQGRGLSCCLSGRVAFCSRVSSQLHLKAVSKTRKKSKRESERVVRRGKGATSSEGLQLSA